MVKYPVTGQSFFSPSTPPPPPTPFVKRLINSFELKKDLNSY